jgi:4-hydroxy-4-methyl-2-oxoglutarate aldolase
VAEGAGAEAFEALRRLAASHEGLSCLASDALERTNGMSGTIRPMWTGARLVGRAVTARALGGDLGAVFDAIDAAEPGDVLVVEGPPPAAPGGGAALWGERTSLSARNRGAVGAVLGAPCRDVAAHSRLAFPVFAEGATPRGAQVVGSGEMNVVVTVGGVVVRPGDAVIGDENGVSIVPAERLAEVLAALPALLEQDRRTQEALARGGTIGALRRAARAPR